MSETLSLNKLEKLIELETQLRSWVSSSISFSSLFSESVSLINLSISLYMNVSRYRLVAECGQASCFALCSRKPSELLHQRLATSCCYLHRPDGACEAWLEWWAHQDLNLGPIDYESTALTN